MRLGGAWERSERTMGMWLIGTWTCKKGHGKLHAQIYIRDWGIRLRRVSMGHMERRLLEFLQMSIAACTLAGGKRGHMQQRRENGTIYFR